MPVVEEKKVIRYHIEYFNKHVDWMGWNILTIKEEDHNVTEFWTSYDAYKTVKNASKYLPEDIKLRVVEVTRIIMDISDYEDID